MKPQGLTVPFTGSMKPISAFDMSAYMASSLIQGKTSSTLFGVVGIVKFADKCRDLTGVLDVVVHYRIVVVHCGIFDAFLQVHVPVKSINPLLMYWSHCLQTAPGHSSGVLLTISSSARWRSSGWRTCPRRRQQSQPAPQVSRSGRQRTCGFDKERLDLKKSEIGSARMINYSLPEFMNLNFLEDHFSGKSKVWPCSGPSTQPVRLLY